MKCLCAASEKLFASATVAKITNEFRLRAKAINEMADRFEARVAN
jgi:hypothetical protein